MGGASTKDNCSASYHNIETMPSQVDNIQRLPNMVYEIPELSEFKLKHEPQQCFTLHMSCLKELLKGDDWLDIPVIQLWSS